MVKRLANFFFLSPVTVPEVFANLTRPSLYLVSKLANVVQGTWDRASK